VKRQHVLQYELAGIASSAVVMPFDVESNAVIALSQKPLCPSSQSTIEVNTERLH
jgi:hypothetical protein